MLQKKRIETVGKNSETITEGQSTRAKQQQPLTADDERDVVSTSCQTHQRRTLKTCGQGY